MRSASDLGADLAMHAEFISADLSDDGNVVKYSVRGSVYTCKAHLLVNAVLDKISTSPSKLAFDLIAGTHIVIDEPAPKGMYYVEAPQDGRAVFVMPWKGKTMIGTTETKYEGDPSLIAPLDSEIEYLCEVASTYFPRLKSLKPSDVPTSFAGLRVLPHAKGRAF